MIPRIFARRPLDVAQAIQRTKSLAVEIRTVTYCWQISNNDRALASEN